MEELGKKSLFAFSCQRILIDIPFGIVFILCTVFSKIYVLSYVAFIAFGSYLFYLVLFKQEFIIKYLAILFAALVSVIGTGIVEVVPRLYLPELQCESGFVGSLPLLIFSYWVLLVVLLNYDAVYGVEIRRFEINMNNKGNVQLLTVITGFVLLLFMLLFSRVATHPAFLLGIDRFVYASVYGVSGILSIIDHISAVLLVFPMLLIIYGNKVLGSLTILIYILYYLWTGNKFGPFLTLMCVFFLVFYKDILKQGKRYLRKTIVLACILGGIIFLYAVIFTISNSNYDSFSYILQRGAQQGQLWWKTYDLCEGIPHPAEFGTEFSALMHNSGAVTESVGASNGIYRIMYLCAPQYMVDAKLATGSRYTEAGYASAYYYFGALGAILFSVIFGLIFALMMNSFLKALNNKDYIKAMIILRFFLIGRGSLSLFIFLDYFDVISLISYLYLIFMWNRRLCIELKKGIQFRFVGYTVAKN